MRARAAGKIVSSAKLVLYLFTGRVGVRLPQSKSMQIGILRDLSHRGGPPRAQPKNRYFALLIPVFKPKNRYFALLIPVFDLKTPGRAQRATARPRVLLHSAATARPRALTQGAAARAQRRPWVGKSCCGIWLQRQLFGRAGRLVGYN